nr:putative disease resistance RPP13-like protein 1 [Ziziphus jujuba var. spinosa]XP_048333709.1 putative disease resistance RPP13-like protein 1 [Ziziphus jujuba var. spinosa]XP_048333710.1 putative disease resistance RPP13-like protein 1 [Ziziphus jujuba var. spinosa]XP_048333711.1 putative disease resistance RPP13-like protein 1 [Ziziphus jujuba var. spinosa]XP_048333712.1 putative disease resistance RPP13-like protein 1 [Ziziphus jujuba var. spinosa]XP_048333713.1 putative disease resistan
MCNSHCGHGWDWQDLSCSSLEIDSLIEKPFDIKAWITVSDESNVFTLTKTIYERVTGSKNCYIEETFELQLELKKFLERKRVLLVLDDVWNLNSKNWGELKSPLESAASGSKIVVTTRNKSIAAKMGTVPNHSLQLLSEEDCWQLFSKQAFNNVEPTAYPKLNEIGIQIVKKCKGLPLAVKSLAGLLNTELNPRKWKNVLQNEIWDLPQEECKILPALWLSYYYLPPHLKQCFAYCSIFPKGYEFQKEILVFLWMAEDLLLPQNNKTLEEVGEEYFDDLASRSLFQKISTCGFTMHDLLNDLATFVAGESCLRFNDNYSKVPLNKIRHLSWKAYKIHDMRKLKDLSENKVLRTLLHLDKGNEVNERFLIHHKRLEKFQCLRVLSLHRVVADMKLLDSIGKLKLLRYLDLSWTEIKEIPCTICSLYNLQTLLLYKCSNLSRLPDSIANLKHLRHLDLSNTEVGEIPDTVCNLHSLHTLLLGSCRKLTHLPTNIEKLINLRRLDISDTSLRETPLQISSLRNLEILSDFVVGTNSGSSIKMLGELQDLRGNLSIRSLEKVENVDDVLEANLKDNKCITDLSLEWGDNNDSQKAREVLNRLQPQTDLERLSIINYGGINFSDWIGDPSFSRIEFMWLSKCKKCHNLPPLGQIPSLKYLTVDGFDMVEKIGDEFYTSGLSPGARPFKSLETLSFKCMPQWKEWSCPEGEVFAQLKELNLMDCPSLTLNEVYFPDTLRSLTCLCIMKCQQVVAALLSKQLPSLCSLRIRDYPELVSFPERRMPTRIHTIQLFGCTNLESFLDEGWPSNLKSLSIGGCGKLFMVRMQWNLQRLTSLTSLDFNCIDEVMNSFPEEGQIPLTLTSLKLSKLNKLRSLNGMAFRQLTSLRDLSIYYCDQLSCLPEEGFPASLSQLDILSCRLLNERCQRDTGQDWSKIARISRIRINNEYI